MANILLGITGSISAYKAVDLANILTKNGHDVRCILTDAAAKFVTPLSLQTMSKNKVYTDMFDESNPKEVTHIALSDWADLCVIAPASANTIAKLANGIADNLLTSTVLALDNKMLIICPAMNPKMYYNPMTQKNLETLTLRKAIKIRTVETTLACGAVGRGGLVKIKNLVKMLEEKYIPECRNFDTKGEPNFITYKKYMSPDWDSAASNKEDCS